MRSLKLKRVFHPIGQGAFYSERHKKDNWYNVVYDCGFWRANSKRADNLVKNSFNERETINLLFISHFDSDHVNRINVLKSEFGIKKVILPLLHESEKQILKGIYSVMYPNDRWLQDLIVSPENFFGEETVVIRVKASSLEKLEKQEPINLEKIVKNTEIESGVPLQIDEWIYVPYNFDYVTRKKELENLFIQKNLDIQKFKNDIDYALANRQKIREAYDKLKGKINKNSMFLYSGPVNRRFNYRQFPPSVFTLYDTIERVGCVYTGDGNLNVVDIKSVFTEYWEEVGTIQVPHHGDIKSFNLNVLDRSYFCPISVGKNSYGHPSDKLISNIWFKRSRPIIVSEDNRAIFYQCIF